MIAALGFGVLLVVALWLGGRGLEALSQIEETHFPLVELSRDLEVLLEQTQRDLRDAVELQDVASLQSADRLRDEFIQRLEQAQGSDVVSREESDLLQTQFGNYYLLARNASVRMIEVGFDEAIAADLDKMREHYNRLADELHGRTSLARREITRQFAQTRDTQALFLAILLGVLCACTLSLWALSRIAAESVLEPLDRTVNAVDRARHGDLTVRAQANENSSGDEIVMLQQGFDTMIEDLRRMVADTGTSATGLTDAAELLRDANKALHDDTVAQEQALRESTDFMELVQGATAEARANAKSLAELATVCANSVAELDRSIGGAAGSIDDRLDGIAQTAEVVAALARSVPPIADQSQLLRADAESAVSALTAIESALAKTSLEADVGRELSTDVSQEAGEGLERVAETGAIVREVERSLQKLGHVVRGLSARSQAIGEVANVIGGVADETSLLALNASIIAAQAGEHGSGFSVVANRMRGLASRSADSTDEIRSLLEGVQSLILDAVRAVEEGEAQAHDGVARAAAASELLKAIREASSACTSRVETIATQSNDHRSSATEVADVVRGVERTTIRFEQLMEEQSRVANMVQGSIESMKEFATLVQTASRNQRSESGKIAVVADNVASSSQQIAVSASHQDAQSEQVRDALDNLARTIVSSRTRSEEIGETVRFLLKRAAELDRSVSQFRT